MNYFSERDNNRSNRTKHWTSVLIPFVKYPQNLFYLANKFQKRNIWHHAAAGQTDTVRQHLRSDNKERLDAAISICLTYHVLAGLTIL